MARVRWVVVRSQCFVINNPARGNADRRGTHGVPPTRTIDFVIETALVVGGWYCFKDWSCSFALLFISLTDLSMTSRRATARALANNDLNFLDDRR